MSHSESSGDVSDEEGSLIEREKIYIFPCDDYHYIRVWDSEGKACHQEEEYEDSDEDEDELKNKVLELSKNTHFRKVKLALPFKTDQWQSRNLVQEGENRVLSETERIEKIKLMNLFNADELVIELEEDAYGHGSDMEESFFDEDDEYSYPPALRLMKYDDLLTTCENWKRVKIEFCLQSITAGEWKQMREGILSRRVSLDSLDVYLYKDDANAFLLEVFGVQFERDEYVDGSYSELQFFSREEGKSVDCYERCTSGRFSVHFFDGLFRTEIYAFNGRFDQFALKMEWMESEEKVAQIKQNYRSVECEVQRRAAKRRAED